MAKRAGSATSGKAGKSPKGGQGTPATARLDAAGIDHRLHPYEPSGPESDASYGQAAADALGIHPARIFKTLVAAVDAHDTVLAVVPVAARLDLKALAAARGGKRAALVEPAAAQRLTGSVVGGISPLGSRRPLPVVLDRSALGFDTVFCSAGRRGLQMELAPADLVTAADAEIADLAEVSGS